MAQAALDAQYATPYNEDLRLGMRFGTLEVVNPFAASSAVHEPAAAYAVGS